MKPELERLKLVIDTQFNGITQFCKSIDEKPDNLRSYFTKDSVPGKKWREKFSEIGINLVWLDHGIGEMMKNRLPIQSSKGVPFYPIDVTASYLRSFDDISELPEYYIDYKPFNDCDAYFPVFGDSMYPMFNSGDVIAVRKINNPNIILWGEPHFVVTDEHSNNMRTLKLLFPQIEDNSQIILRALNPDFSGDIVIPKESIINLFIVKGKISQRML